MRAGLQAVFLACASLGNGALRGQEMPSVCDAELVAFEQPPLDVFDADGDGVITPTEASGCETLATLFDRLDLDANGALTAVEFDGFANLWENRARTFGEEGA